MKYLSGYPEHVQARVRELIEHGRLGTMLADKYGQAHAVRVGLSRPGRDARRIARLLAPKLEVVDPGFGIEIVTVQADGVETLSAVQHGLDAQDGAGLEDGLAPLVDRLINRLGEDRVWRAEPFQSHVPERSVVRRPPLAKGSGDIWDPARPRPARLLRRPERIEVVAQLPDEPPARFTWRGRPHRVRHAEGPERIGQEWWRKAFDQPERETQAVASVVPGSNNAQWQIAFFGGLIKADPPAVAELRAEVDGGDHRSPPLVRVTKATTSLPHT